MGGGGGGGAPPGGDTASSTAMGMAPASAAAGSPGMPGDSSVGFGAADASGPGFGSLTGNLGKMASIIVGNIPGFVVGTTGLASNLGAGQNIGTLGPGGLPPGVGVGPPTGPNAYAPSRVPAPMASEVGEAVPTSAPYDPSLIDLQNELASLRAGTFAIPKAEEEYGRIQTLAARDVNIGSPTARMQAPRTPTERFKGLPPLLGTAYHRAA